MADTTLFRSALASLYDASEFIEMMIAGEDVEFENQQERAAAVELVALANTLVAAVAREADVTADELDDDEIEECFGDLEASIAADRDDD